MRSPRVLVERDRATEAIDRLVARLRSGQGGAVFLVAGPGLGKTSVLRRAMDTLGDSPGALVECRHAAAAAFEQGIPYAALAPVLPDLVRAADLHPQDVRGMLFFRAAESLAGRTSPLLIALDDLHWADPDSLALLAFLVRRCRAAPVGFIGALRAEPTEAVTVTDALCDEGFAVRVELPALTSNGTSVLLTALGVTAVDPAEWHARAGGNPLLLTQLAAGAESNLGPTMLRRIADLPASVRRVLDAAAVLGHRLRVTDVAGLSGVEEADLTDALARLQRLGLMTGSTPGLLEFSHPLVRDDVYDALSPGYRERLHAAAFTLLAERTGRLAESADHAVLGGLTGDPVAIEVVQRAAGVAESSGATEAALRLRRRVLELAGDAATPAHRLAFGDAELLRGGLPAAEAAFREVMNDPAASADERARALRGMGVTAYEANRLDEASHWMHAAADLATETDPYLATEFLLDVAGMSSAIPIDVCVKAADRALELACDGPQRVRATTVGAFVRMLTGDLSLVEEAKRLATAACLDVRGTTWSPAATLRNLGQLAYMLEDFTLADRAFGAMVSWAEEHGAPLAAMTTKLCWTDSLAREGRSAELLAFLDDLDEVAQVAPHLQPLAAFARAASRCDFEPDEVTRRRLTEAQDGLGPDGFWAFRAWLHTLRARLDLRARAPVEASDRMLLVEELVIDHGLVEPCAITWARDAVLAHLGAGREADARRVLDDLDRGASATTCLWPRTALLVARAHLAEHAEPDAARRLFEEALTLHKSAGLPAAYADDLTAFGGFLRRTGEVARARTVLADALATAERIGARGLADAALAELRVAGGRRRRHDDDGMTEQESRVTRLAAQGRSNAEIAASLHLSVKTVETHLGHAYAKLGIRSRRELAERLGR